MKIFLALSMILFLSGCGGIFGKETQRKTFDYSKSPCACADQGHYFNGVFYPARNV